MPKKLLAILLSLMMLLTFVPTTVFAEEPDGQPTDEIENPLPKEELEAPDSEVIPSPEVIPNKLEIQQTDITQSAPAAVIKDIFPDVNFAGAIATKLGKAITDTVTQAELDSITVLDAHSIGVKNLEGMQYLVNITWLNLSGNSINNISILAGLANLTHLYLSNNSINDISALAGLTNLEELDLTDQVVETHYTFQKTFPSHIVGLNGEAVAPTSGTLVNCTYSDGEFTFINTSLDAQFSFSQDIGIGTFSGIASAIKYIGSDAVAVTGVSLNTANAILTVGGTQQLNAAVTPDNATNKALTWSSNNTSVATVDANGIITAVGKGSATITVTTADGGFSATCSVTVNSPVAGSYQPNKLPSSGIKGNAIEVQLMNGAVSQGITSGNSKAIVVNGNILEFVGAGKSTVKVTYQVVNAKTGKITSKTVSKTITITSKVTGVSLNTNNATIAKKQKVTLKSYIAPSDATNKTITWTTSNKKVATVTNKGVVAGVGAGTCTITAKTKDGGYAAYATITVTPIYESAIKLNKTSISLAKGKTFQLKASFTPSNTDFKAVTWVSDNPDVATVDSKGKVKAIQTGTCTITATSANDKVAYFKITTLPQKVTSVKLGSTASNQNAGAIVEIPVVIGPANADNKVVAWSSSNTGIATVTQDGIVTFRFAGKVTITAKATDGSKKSASKTFTVSGFILGEYTKYDIPPEDLTDKRFAAMIREAEKYLGYPYVWGGSSPSTSFDCSGFVCWVINQSKVGKVGRTTAQGLYNKCKPIAPSEAKPGDLIFFTGTYVTSKPVTHVGIYVGNGMMIHCGDPISYSSIYTPFYIQQFYAFGRLP